MRNPLYFVPPFFVLAALYLAALYSGRLWLLPLLGLLITGTAVAYGVTAARLIRYDRMIRRRARTLRQLRTAHRKELEMADQFGDEHLDDSECPLCTGDAFRLKGTDDDFVCVNLYCRHQFPYSKRSMRPIPTFHVCQTCGGAYTLGPSLSPECSVCAQAEFIPTPGESVSRALHDKDEKPF